MAADFVGGCWRRVPGRAKLAGASPARVPRGWRPRAVWGILRRIGLAAPLVVLWARGTIAWPAETIRGGLSSSVGQSAPGSTIDPTEALFAGTNFLRVRLEIDAAGINRLRWRPGQADKPRVPARVLEGTNRWTNVGVQLKGFSSFRPIDDRPSLTLRFDRQDRAGLFHGLAKLSLNNSIQDPSCLHEVVGREMFAAAGVPVPRAVPVLVTLNGRDLGLYVLTEGFDQRFLRRHFADADGVLYEGGTLEDIGVGMRIVSGAEPADRSPLAKLLEAAALPDPEARYHSLDGLLDLERFFNMMAVETILCHSDSYTMNRNNYRLYYSAAAGQFTFLAHGMDRILGGHRSDLDLTILPPQLGKVSRALLTTGAGRRRYLERLGSLVTNLVQPATWCARIHGLDRCLRPARLGEPSAPFDPGPGMRGPDNATDLCRRLTFRAEELSRQLEALSAHLGQTHIPAFDAEGRCGLLDWVWRPVAGQVPVRCQREVGGNAAGGGTSGGAVLRLQAALGSTNGIVATLIHRLTLPAGVYRLEGGWTEYPTNAVRVGAAFIQRWSMSRFQPRREAVDWRSLDATIQVRENVAPEEVELQLEIQSEQPEVRLDPGAIRLVTDVAGRAPGLRRREPGAGRQE